MDLEPVNIPKCVIQSSVDYSIPVRLILAIQKTEGGKIGMKNKNRNGTYDYGVMQINTIWINKLKNQFKIDEEMVMNDYCLSVRTAAYILRYEINLEKGNFWSGIGHYHSRTKHLKDAYIMKVYKNSLLF